MLGSGITGTLRFNRDTYNQRKIRVPYLEDGDPVATVVQRGTVGDTEAGGSVESEGRGAVSVEVRHRRIRRLEATNVEMRRLLYHITFRPGVSIIQSEAQQSESETPRLLVGQLHSTGTTARNETGRKHHTHHITSRARQSVRWPGLRANATNGQVDVHLHVVA